MLPMNIDNNQHNIGWVARLKHDPKSDGFKRAGRFKKALNGYSENGM